MTDVNTDDGAMLEALNDKADRDLNNTVNTVDYVVERGGNSSKWYKRWKSGWLEQGGIQDLNNGGDIQFLKPYANTNVTVLCTPNTNTTAWPIAWGSIANVNYLHIDGTGNYSTADRSIKISWKTEGQGA